MARIACAQAAAGDPPIGAGRLPVRAVAATESARLATAAAEGAAALAVRLLFLLMLLLLLSVSVSLSLSLLLSSLLSLLLLSLSLSLALAWLCPPGGGDPGDVVVGLGAMVKRYHLFPQAAMPANDSFYACSSKVVTFYHSPPIPQHRPDRRRRRRGEQSRPERTRRRDSLRSAPLLEQSCWPPGRRCSPR